MKLMPNYAIILFAKDNDFLVMEDKQIEILDLKEINNETIGTLKIGALTRNEVHIEQEALEEIKRWRGIRQEGRP